MAYYKKLTEGWRLTDGICPEVLLEKPCPVYEALREAGYLPDASQGLNALSCEWIAAREWTYSLLLDVPDEDDERILLELPHVTHAGSAYLNGEFINDFHSGDVLLDLTGAVRPEESNLLELRLTPAPYVRPRNALPVPAVGLMAAPVLRAVSFVTVEAFSLSSRMEGTDGVLRAELALDAHTGGKYHFHYALMLDGEAVSLTDITEKLPAARRRIVHEIRVPGAVLLDPERMDETVYSLKFTMDRGGTGCDVRHMETAFRRDLPAKCLAVSAWPVPEETVSRLLALGAEGVLLTGAPDNRTEKNDFLGGLTVVEEVPAVQACGMMRAEEIRSCASGETYWPPESMLWRLRGGREAGEPLPGETAEKYALRIRYEQAVSIRKAAETARRDRKPVAFPADEAFPFFAGNSVIGYGGELRPAAYMLRKVWNGPHIFPEAEGGQLSLWVLAENLKGRVLTASLTVMKPDGETLSEASFPVMGGDVRLAGVLANPAREETVVLRAVLTDDRQAEIARTDVLTGNGSDLAEASLSRSGGRVINEGSCAAVSAGVILMPGEEADDTDQEWLNA